VDDLHDEFPKEVGYCRSWLKNKKVSPHQQHVQPLGLSEAEGWNTVKKLNL
jgi:hypothetical protein